MEEILVITACLYQKGCSESATKLYESRPALQEFAKKTERQAKEIAGPVVMDYVAPMAMFAAGASGVVRVSETIGIEYSRKTTVFIFKKEF